MEKSDLGDPTERKLRNSISVDAALHVGFVATQDLFHHKTNVF